MGKGGYSDILPETKYRPTRKQKTRNTGVTSPQKGAKDRRDTAVQTKDHAY